MRGVLSMTPRISFLYQNVLGRVNSFYRANISTCTTVGTDIRVNLVNIAFGDGINGTFIDTSSACRAFIRNFVSHIKII